MRFRAEVALVTGAGSGVGLAASARFAVEGCRVVATVEKHEHLAALDGMALAHKAVLDVTREDDWQKVIAEIETRVGPVDILFNNAGVTFRGDLEATGRDLWDNAILVNLTSVYLGCRAVIGGMLARGRGAIVNNASINGLRGNTGLIAYTAAKGGVVAMTRSLALDYAKRGVRVNCICPAAIDTRMTRDYLGSITDPAEVERAIIAKHPIGRMASAEEVAAVAVFLASDDAAFMTGLAIPVDGGRTIG